MAGAKAAVMKLAVLLLAMSQLVHMATQRRIQRLHRLCWLRAFPPLPAWKSILHPAMASGKRRCCSMRQAQHPCSASSPPHPTVQGKSLLGSRG
uniref:Hbc8 protein n=1 Tax=Hordeum bulbosum TaxID=4516 RepID=Q39965_HORBU|nr:putative [Hordeum bulbosum]